MTREIRSYDTEQDIRSAWKVGTFAVRCSAGISQFNSAVCSWKGHYA